jgi:hypothetical protein
MGPKTLSLRDNQQKRKTIPWILWGYACIEQGVEILTNL